VKRAVTAFVLAIALFVIASISLGGGTGARAHRDTVGKASAQDALAPAGTDALTRSIATLQSRLRSKPVDAVGWATLGLNYVQQAKVTVDPSYYTKAGGVLATSLRLQPVDNFVAAAGQAALAAARHDFAGARTWAQQGIDIDPYNATLYGALDDADTQLGLYDEAFAATQKMLDLRPGTPAFSRAEYVFELRGETAKAVESMQRALQQAPTPADAAFARYFLAQLAFDSGHAQGALLEISKGIAADPTYPALIEGRAKAEAALGQTDAALKDYADIVGRVPQPEYVVEYGELLESVGRTAEAKAQYDLFLTEERLFQSSGVALDTDPTLFAADHGDPTDALAYAKKGILIRPFIEMQDAYAWALHVNGRDREALTVEQKALSLGTRSALFHFHLGMIQKSLGDRASARTALTSALTINPHFNPLQAPVATKALAELGDAA